MIRVRRLPCPDILEQKAATWTARFVQRYHSDELRRPPNNQYAHAEVKACLAAMSHRKCCYCETLLDEEEFTVDHYVEVAQAPERAFDWDNLYLCCHGCQSKLSERTIPRAECLDPCDPKVDPAEHLRFDDERILPRQSSPRGRQTIDKYKLNRGDLERRRLRQIKQFYKLLLAIGQRQLRETRTELNDTERQALHSFGAPDNPYSLMFRDLLATPGLG